MPASYELAINVIGRDRASGPLASVRRALERIGEVALGVATARALERIAEGFYYMGAQALEAVGKFQMIELTLQSLAARELVQLSDGVLTVADVFPKATAKAAELMDELSRLAILSPYQVDAIMYTYRMAMAFGYTTDEAMDFTKALSNIAAGIGADMDMLERMAYNLAQVRLQGKVTALDIRQLALAGFDLRTVLRYVATQMGYNIKSHLDFNKLIDQGKITWQDFTKYFAKYAEENFAGASERMARSLLGLKSTFNDVFILTAPQILKPAVEVITGLLGELLNGFLALRDSPVLARLGTFLENKVKAWIAPWQKFVDIVVGAMESLGELEGPRMGGMQEGMGESVNLLERYGGLLGTVRYALEQAFGPSVILTAFDTLVKIWDILRAIATAVGALFRGDIEGVVGALGLKGPVADLAITVLTTIVELVDRLKNAMVALLDADLHEVIEALEFDPQIQTALFTVGKALKNLWEFVTTYGPDVIRVFGEFLARLFGLAEPNVEAGVAGFADAFLTFTQNILNNGPQIVDSLDEFLTKVTDEWIPAAKNFVNTLITEWIPALGRVATFVMNTVVPAVVVLIGLFAASKVASMVNGIIGIIGNLSKLGEVLDLVGGFGPFLAQTFGFVGPATAGLSSLLAFLAPILPIILAIASAVALLGLAWSQNWGGFRDKAMEVWATIQEVLKPAFDEFMAAIAPLWEALQVLWVQLQPILSIVAQAIGGLLVVVLGILTGLIGGIVNFVTIFVQMFTKLVQDLVVVFNGIVSFFTSLWEFIVGIFTLNGDKIRAGLAGMGQAVLQIFGGALHALATLVAGAVAAVVGFFRGFIETIINFFVNLYQRLVGGSIIPEMLAAILQAFAGFFASALAGFATWVIGVISKVGELATKLFKVGQDIVKGLWDGIKAKWQQFIAWLSGAVDDVIKLAKKILGIGSPSKVFEELGTAMMQGWSAGIRRSAFMPYGAVRATAAMLPGAAATITQQNTFNVQDRIDAEYVARRAAQLILEASEL